MSEREFWRLTPREYDALRKRWEAKEERDDYRAGQIACVVANSQPRKKGRRPYKPEDFMPRRAKAVAQKAAQTLDVVWQRVSSLFTMFGGQRKADTRTEAQRRQIAEQVEKYKQWKIASLKDNENG